MCIEDPTQKEVQGSYHERSKMELAISFYPRFIYCYKSSLLQVFCTGNVYDGAVWSSFKRPSIFEFDRESRVSAKH